MSRSSEAPGRPLCPSAPCEPGALVLGVVSAEGRIEFLDQPSVIGERFVEIARQGRAPEKRFRFASTCMEKGCANWSQGRCGVSDDVLLQIGARPLPETLVACHIRAQCRWFLQSGAQACASCQDIVTDLT